MFFVVITSTRPGSPKTAYGSPATNETFGLAVNGTGDLLTVQGYGNDYVSTEPGTGEGWLLQSAVLDSGR